MLHRLHSVRQQRCNQIRPRENNLFLRLIRNSRRVSEKKKKRKRSLSVCSVLSRYIYTSKRRATLIQSDQRASGDEPAPEKAFSEGSDE
ncbi:hypothetical protein EYF80_016069 [Liparis tanakae]|uniref:Uncharacterized protein n=1 Tax=Liparis tanakae TaxID=230148 RepID=A0A4Z2I6K5_9TELE|nr:hypothetical protein EYF80_016069 [Liparis tanakae]